MYMIRSINTEQLQDICEDIAMDNYGFVYIGNHKGKIKEAYEQCDTGFKYKSTLSLSDIKQGMQEIAEDDFSTFQRLRGDSYFMNPFENPQGQQIGEELESLFTAELVLHKKRFESKFDIAPTDVDFFAEKLLEEEYISRIPAGERDYFVSGPKLKDETSRDVGLDAQLTNRSDSEGKLSHNELEAIIDVAATENVIDYLSQNDYVIDLDGEYLVQAALDTFAESLAERIEDPVIEEFEEGDYVLHIPEFERVIENKITESTDVLREARSVRNEILAATKEALTDQLELEEQSAYNMVVIQDHTVDGNGFDSFISEQARAVKKQVARSDETITKKSEQIDAGDQHIAEREVGRTEKSREFIRDEIRDQYENLVDEEW